ncbi:hypothetical protein ANN_22231 [Periplaneta americana]|uniref:Uncharacterized protein n=1 Tax=Periplaneta americana TaxID=6978 RepID=A0ABQ8S7T5_PERAM|nr:hypothetical protein ANN_22231 [Periplaneta americana]
MTADMLLAEWTHNPVECVAACRLVLSECSGTHCPLQFPSGRSRVATGERDRLYEEFAAYQCDTFPEYIINGSKIHANRAKITDLRNETYKIIKHLNKTEKDAAYIPNLIKEEQWIKYFQDLWFNNNADEIQPSKDNYDVDLLGIEELEEALKHKKCRKASGPDAELIKYGNTFFKLRFFTSFKYVLD